MFLTIFVKKSFFFMAKKFFDAIFFVEVTKKNEKSLYQMKVGIKFGKVKKFGIGWCILHRMAADNAKGGSVRTPPIWDRVKRLLIKMYIPRNFRLKNSKIKN